MAVKYADARHFALALPGVTEEPHFDVASFRVNKRILATVPPGNMLHVFVPDADRDMLLELYARCTEKVYWGGKVVGIRVFLGKATRRAVEDLLLRAWKHRAPKKVVAAYESSPKPSSSPRLSSPRAADKTVDAYIATFPPAVRTRLAKVRATIRKAAPQAEESISYRIPAYKLGGTLIYFAGFANHIGVYPAPRDSIQFRDELAAYAGGKGTVQFPHDQPLPLNLIRRIVQFRAAENAGRVALKTASRARGTIC